MMVRASDKVMDFIADQGVGHVFTVSGGGAISLDDALGLNKRLQYVCCHHEQAAAIAAEAYARTSDGLGVTLVTTGPGGTNAISGVAGSWLDSVPHLVLSGQVYLSQTIGNSGLRQLGSQELAMAELVRPITKYSVMVTDVKDVLYEVEKAVYIARSGRPGPVWVDIPANIQNAKIEELEYRRFNPSEIPALVYDQDIEQKAQKVAELLHTAKRPLFHLGQGVKISGGLDIFFRIIERFKIPFVTARNANELVDWEHPLYVGRPGTFPQRGANFAVQNADVYVAVGTRLSLPQTGYNSKDYARHAFKVMVDIDRSELDKKTLNIDLKVHADGKVFLEALERALEGRSLTTGPWVQQCQQWKQKYPAVLPEYRAQVSPVNSYVVADALSDVLGPDDVIVTDMGFAFQTTHQAFRVKKGQRFFTNCGLSSMGWGLPAAIGACFAHGGKRVICIAGEGGFQMTSEELAVVMHHRLPIKLFVYNNGGYLTIKQSYEIGFAGRLMGCNKETGLSFPDLMKIAEAYAIPAVRIDRQDQLRADIQRVVDAPGPMICELMMDENQPQIPKAIPRYQPDGTSIQTPLEDLYPFLSREELEENMIAEKKETI